MSNDEHEDWSEDEDNAEEQPSLEVQKLLAAVDAASRKAIRYLELEGFVEKTEAPGIYKYTPEGLALAKRQFKQMKDQGLL